MIRFLLASFFLFLSLNLQASSSHLGSNHCSLEISSFESIEDFLEIYSHILKKILPQEKKALLHPQNGNCAGKAEFINEKFLAQGFTLGKIFFVPKHKFCFTEKCDEKKYISRLEKYGFGSNAVMPIIKKFGWTYHVASFFCVKVDGAFESFVFDAALSPNKPLSVDEWIFLMTGVQENIRDIFEVKFFSSKIQIFNPEDHSFSNEKAELVKEKSTSSFSYSSTSGFGF